MAYLILKAGLSGVLILIISEVAKRYPSVGGLIASLPLISLLAIIWLWRDTGGDTVQIARHARATLWYVVPSLPFFLILPALLDRGMMFWTSLAISVGCTFAFYGAAVWIAARLAVTFG